MIWFERHCCIILKQKTKNNATGDNICANSSLGTKTFKKVKGF